MVDTTWTPIDDPTAFQDDAVFEIVKATKTIQVLVEQPIVAGENKSQLITFQMGRFYDAIDLTQMEVNILFESPTGYQDISSAVNREYSDEYIRFGWLVPYAACPVKGILSFAVEFVGADYTLKTTKSTTDVLDSISGSSSVPEPTEQTWYIELQSQVAAAINNANSTLESVREYIDTFQGNIDDAIDNWFDAHPEATTTVQDGAITEAKLADALKLKTIKDYVTPEMYGAVGDGVTDDTQALQAMFDDIARIKTSQNVICIGKGRYKTETITISGDRYSDAYNVRLIGLTLVCNETLVFTGESNHYNYTFESCSFFANVNNAVLFNNYVFSHSVFENCYFNGFKNVIYGDVFIQMMKFEGCVFKDCTNVFDFTAVYTMYIENCIFTGCDHVFTQELLNGDVSTSLRNIQRLIVNKCTFENYTDYVARLVCFSEITFKYNYFDNGNGNGHGIIIASDADYTRGRHVLVVENNHVQMAVSSVSPKLLIFENTDIDCGTITDNYSYNTYIADLSNLTVNKKLIYKRNTREGDTQTFLFTPYRFTNMVLDENLPARQIGSINGAVYYFKMIKGKAIIYRSVNTGTVSVGDIKKITFNFTNNTTVDLSQISPFDLNNNAKNMGCYNNNGTVTLFEMVLSSDYDSANNPIGFAVN